MSLVIRPIETADAQATLDLLQPILRAGCFSALTGPLDLESQLAWIRDIQAAGLCLVAEASDVPGSILGMQDVMPLEAEPTVGDISTFVSLEHHRQGIGRTLMEATLEAVPALGIRKLRADNPQAQAFYAAQGFRETGRLQNSVQVGEQWLDQVVLEREIYS